MDPIIVMAAVPVAEECLAELTRYVIDRVAASGRSPWRRLPLIGRLIGRLAGGGPNPAPAGDGQG
jgi:hypothetical protein